jgi:outer membrane lipoprotein carrier protein
MEYVVRRSAWRALFVLTLLLSVSASVFAASKHARHTGGKARLDKYLQEFMTLKASFEQVLLNEKGSTIETAHGTVYLQRPGRFRWDYEKPYEQSIVADGTKVWIYDKDLAQVTVKPLQAAIGNTPALLLGGKVDIDKEFIVKEQGATNGLTWVVLHPRSKDNQYADIRLGFEATAVKQMELHDNLGQTTRITFSAEERNPTIDPAIFQFTPPQGVDVINAKDL